MRNQIDSLAPQAQTAKALLDSIGTSRAGQTDDFLRTLAALTRLGEQGLWLTGLTIGSGGKRLELQGEARSGAQVLRYARRANESLKPLDLRLDSLEMQPAAGAAATSAGAVSFRLY